MADSAKMIAKELMMQVRELAQQVSSGSPVEAHQLDDIADEIQLIHGMLPTPESVGGKPFPVESGKDQPLIHKEDGTVAPKMADPGKSPGDSSKNASATAKARTNIDTDVKSPIAAKQEATDHSAGDKDVTGKPGVKK